MRKILVIMLVIFAISVTGCSGGETIISETEYEKVDYKLYPAPDDGYVGDTMPFAVDDTLEFYYLYDTDHNGQGYHPIHKYSTTNFCEYKDHGEVLKFGNMDEPDPAIGTGSVVMDKDGLYHLFYTGHNDIEGNTGKDRECVMHATSADRENWTKIPEDTFYSEENYSSDDFRDPFVFWNEEDGCYWLLMAAREKTQGGVVAKYISEDLKNWELCEPLYAPHEQYMLECPDLFKMGDYYYLTYSWDCVTYYAMSKSVNGPFEAPEDNVLDGNNFIFYAAKTGLLNENRYLCGWLGRAALANDSGMYNWAGNMLNHQLVQKEDGTLGVREPESFSSYFTEGIGGKVTEKEIKLSGKEGEYSVFDFGMRLPTMMLECDVAISENGCAGFAFGSKDEEESYTALCLDARHNLLHYEGQLIENVAKDWDPVAFTKFDFSKDEVHHVKLICENEIVIMYVDDTKALSSRINSSIEGAHIGVFTTGADASFSNVKIKIPKGL